MHYCKMLQSIVGHYGMLQKRYGVLQSATEHYRMLCDVTGCYRSAADCYGTLWERYIALMERYEPLWTMSILPITN